MSRAVKCPSCGAEHTVSNPGITALQCEFCKTLIYWDEQAVKAAGSKAILDPPSSALRVGEALTLKGQDMTVLGRVRYSYGAGEGLWDEWFLEDAAQNIIWLNEDEKEFTLEKPIADDPALPAYAALKLGGNIQVHGQSFVVEELGKAACLGVEGQVPFVVIPEEIYPFADLASSDGKISIGIEYDKEGSASIFQGTFIDRADLKVDGQPPFPEVVSAGMSIRCSGCGAPVEGNFPADSKMLVCSSCGAGLQISDTQTRVITKNKGKKPNFVLDIGDVGVFDKQKYEVTGRLHYLERDEGIDYPSDEYLLWNEKNGYLWLEESDGHWLRSKRSHKQPGIDLFAYLAPRSKVKIGATSYQFVESGLRKLTYVDGALPWKAVVGQNHEYADLAAPPRSFSAERTRTSDGAELEYFEGKYQPLEDMQKAFKGKKFPNAIGVNPAQPFIRTASQKIMIIFGLVFALVNFALLFSTCGSGKQVFHATLSAEQYRGEWLSEPFQIKRKPSVVRISGRANISQAWMSIQMGLVNANDEMCLETDAEPSYYSGRSGGESWSEGSTKFSKLIRVDKPGNYRLLVYASAARGNANADDKLYQPKLFIEVEEGLALQRYYLWMLFFSLLYPIKERLRKYSFEQKRIPVESDDD